MIGLSGPGNTVQNLCCPIIKVIAIIDGFLVFKYSVWNILVNKGLLGKQVFYDLPWLPGSK